MNFIEIFSKNIQISNSKKIPSMGTELCMTTHGRTNRQIWRR